MTFCYHQALKDSEEKSNQKRSAPPAMFFEIAVLKIFRKFLEKHPSLSSHSAYLQAFKKTDMLNVVFPLISSSLNNCCLLISVLPLNASLIRIVTKFY